MSSGAYSSVRLTLSKHSAESFLAALDEAQVPHGPIHMFSNKPQASGMVEAITALSDAMPCHGMQLPRLLLRGLRQERAGK